MACAACGWCGRRALPLAISAALRAQRAWKGGQGGREQRRAARSASGLCAGADCAQSCSPTVPVQAPLHPRPPGYSCGPRSDRGAALGGQAGFRDLGSKRGQERANTMRTVYVMTPTPGKASLNLRQAPGASQSANRAGTGPRGPRVVNRRAKRKFKLLNYRLKPLPERGRAPGSRSVALLIAPLRLGALPRQPRCARGHIDSQACD